MGHEFRRRKQRGKCRAQSQRSRLHMQGALLGCCASCRRQHRALTCRPCSSVARCGVRCSDPGWLLCACLLRGCCAHMRLCARPPIMLSPARCQRAACVVSRLSFCCNTHGPYCAAHMALLWRRSAQAPRPRTSSWKTRRLLVLWCGSWLWRRRRPSAPCLQQACPEACAVRSFLFVLLK